MYNINSESLLKLKKVLAFVFSLGLIGISIWFSQLGFGIEATKDYSWIGWFLGCTVTVIELTFNTNIKTLSPTLIFAGILAYIYGMWTNVVALQDIFGGNLVFAIIVGLFVEVVPEPLFAWSIGVHDGGDVVGNIGHLFGNSQPPRPQPTPQSGFAQFAQHEQQQPKWTYPPLGQKSKNQKKAKLVSPIFNDQYTKRFKK